MLFSTLAVAALSAVASAKTIRIDVGESGLNFSPNDIKADKGDVLTFFYHAPNHSVVAADFATPCQPKAEGGFYSGFFPTSGESKNVFEVTVNDTNPIWFYCSQPVGNHCSAGMVGAVNANADKTLAMFKSAAGKVNSNQSPSNGPFGGRVLSAASATKSSGGSSSSSSSTSTGSPAATTTNAAATLGSISGMALAVVGAAVAFAI
ncbi:Cupredoxin [Trichoderma novae-zelandiae]